MIKVFNGIPIIIDNTIVANNEKEKYYVSYNPSTRDYGIDTTALVIMIGNNEREVFYILKGDHRKSYNRCTNLKDCVQYYMDNKNHIHKFSDSFKHQHILT